MTTRQAFSDLFNNTRVSESLTEAEKAELYSAIDAEAKKLLPKSLFRYRACNENNLSAFEKDEIWFSTADCMNDGFDARAYISKENKEKILAQIENTFKAYNKEQLTELLKKELLPKVSPETQYAISLLPGWFEQNKDDIPEMARGEILTKIISIPIVTQLTSRICCFSESIKSAAMWGLYGKDETGFCLEYDFSKLPHISPKSYDCLLYPVVYSNQRLEMPYDYLNYLLWNTLLNRIGLSSAIGAEIKKYIPVLVCPDLMLATKIIMNKSANWSYEKEWRLMLTNVDFKDNKHHSATKRATAVYLGRRITPINEKLLCLLAKEKGLPVFKMQLDDSSPTYELAYHRLQ